MSGIFWYGWEGVEIATISWISSYRIKSKLMNFGYCFYIG